MKIHENRVRSEPALVASLIPFHLLNDCLPGRCAFSDIDGVAGQGGDGMQWVRAATERNGHWLMLEWKREGQWDRDVNRGQRDLLLAPTRQPHRDGKPFGTLFVVEGPTLDKDATDPEAVEWRGRIKAPGAGAPAWRDADYFILLHYLLYWSRWVDPDIFFEEYGDYSPWEMVLRGVGNCPQPPDKRTGEGQWRPS